MIDPKVTQSYGTPQGDIISLLCPQILKLAILSNIKKIGLPMAKINYGYEKHGREIEKKKKKEEKLKKKLAKKNEGTPEEKRSTPSDAPNIPEA